MKWVVCLCVSLISLSSYVSGLVVSSPRTLVLIDNPATKITHSTFFHQLTERGHRLTYSNIYDDTGDVTLEKYGEYFFDNLVIFAPTADDFGEKIKVDGIVNFIDSGRNVLIAVNENVTEPLRELANEVGVDLDEEGTVVIDHLNYDSNLDKGYHTVIAATSVLNAPSIVGSSISSPILFNGIGHATTESSRLIFRLLTGGETTYSAPSNSRVDEYPQSTGADTSLVTAIQTRNNARVLISGSMDVFSNLFFSSPVHVQGKYYPKSGNQEFAISISKWVFAEKGILRATNLQHKLQGGNEINPKAYRIMDNIEFSVVLEEWNGGAGEWQPFNGDDAQLEFVMLDPYIRTRLTSDGKGTYSTAFQVPDVYGVYKFRLNYNRLGYSALLVEQQVSVHPYRHDQFERFIDVAFPYYVSAFSCMAAFFIFGIVFLYQSE